MIIAYGYTNIDNVQESNKAIKNIKIPMMTPRMAKSNFMQINHKQPSTSNVNISIGALILQVQIFINIYPRKLLFKITQEINVNIETEIKIPKTFSFVEGSESQMLKTIINEIKLDNAPNTNDK